jgi:hypothetical protein
MQMLPTSLKIKQVLKQLQGAKEGFFRIADLIEEAIGRIIRFAHYLSEGKF